ncbi:MAG: DUF4837 family protein [Gemmatimonadota bacterium]|nr:DUF4837 family protein [Gemmatimonadota bacterium]
MTLRTWLIGLAFAVLTAGACEEIDRHQRRSLGNFRREKEILVICSDSVWKAVEKDLRRAVEKTILAVRREQIFEISQTNAEFVSYYKEWNKVILIESLENQALLADVVEKKMLDKISQGQGLFFTNFDVWATGQRVAGLAASRDDQLGGLVREYGDRIFKDFLRQLEENEKLRMFGSGKNRTLADSLAREQGFSIMLPQVYEPSTRGDSLPPNQMLWVHMDPVRSVFISWCQGEDLPEQNLSKDSLAAARDRLVGEIYPSARTVPGRVDTSTVSAQGLERLRVYGVWENHREMSGGVYITHIIEVPEQNRRYTIDCLLFCPDPRQNKYRFLFQLDRILESFKVCGTVTKEEKK